MLRNSPIVVLDSGLGGLTVVRSLRKLLPAEDIVYFGDTARLPYGSKSPEVVRTFVSQIIRFLRPLDPKHVVIACNTATALALPEARAEFPELSVSGVVEPGARAGVDAAAADSAHISVIATEATVRSRAYEKAIARRDPGAVVTLTAAPLLVPIIEDGRDAACPLARLAVEQYLAPAAKTEPDVLVLGCTHYPILRELIEATLSRLCGREVPVVDSADHCAQDVARRLAVSNLLRGPGGLEGTLRCWVTDDSPRFAKLASRFLGYSIPSPEWVSPDELTNGSPSPVQTLRRAI